ncbi:MAG: hypothetical protein AseanaTS_06650 [Candidatus Pelagadaptatus aseana]|uniref:hypothetical protein n=1 Tax=Candidatus Pelagadaptatus aseana TaxID=3120508 RepID=UPI0039B30B12
MAAEKHIIVPLFALPKLIGLILLCLHVYPPLVQASSEPLKTLRLSCVLMPDSQIYNFILGRYNRAWNPLGYRIEFVHASPANAIPMLRLGMVDGSCGRDRDFAKIHNVPNMAPLQQPSATSTIHAIALRGANIDPDRQKLKVGYIPTFKRVSAKVGEMGYGELIQFETMKQMIGALKSSAIDLAVVPDVFLHSRDQQFIESFTTHAVVLTQTAYAQLDRKWHHLIKPFSRRLAVVNAEAGHSQPTARFKRSSTDDKQIIFSCGIRPDGQSFIDFGKAAETAFNNLGYDFKLIYLSRLRERVELEQGHIDGSCARSAHYIEHISTNTLMIKTPLARDNMDIFSNDPDVRINNLSELPDAKTVGFVRGSYTVTHHLKNSRRQLVEVPDIATGLRMLDSGKLDFFVDFKHAVIEYLDLLPLNNTVYTSGRLTTSLFYPSIHKKHASLLPELNREFEKILNAKGQQTLLKR